MGEINLDLIMGKGEPRKGETPEGEGKELVDLVNKIKDIAMADSKKPEDTLNKITDIITSALGSALTGGKPGPEDDKKPGGDNPFDEANKKDAEDNEKEEPKGDNPFEAIMGKPKVEGSDKPEFPRKKDKEEDEEE